MYASGICALANLSNIFTGLGSAWTPTELNFTFHLTNDSYMNHELFDGRFSYNTTQKRHIDPRLSQNSNAKNKIELLNQELRSFFLIQMFDDIAFLQQFDGLCQQVRAASSMINFVDSLDPSILEQFTLCKNLFQSMMHAACMMKIFTLHEDPAKGLVHKTILLNIRLWTLKDSKGHPDPEVNDYNVNLHHYGYILHSWTRMFERLKDVPDDVRNMFNIQRSHAANTLNVLFNHLQVN